VVRALPAEPVRPQPEELTRDQALEASARAAEDPPTPAGRVTPTLIGPRRESSLRRDRGIRRPLLDLTGRLLRASNRSAGHLSSNAYQQRQRPMATALPAPQHQNQAREARLRVDVDAGEIDRLHLAAPAAIDVKPAIACFQCGADRRRPVMCRCGVPALDDRRATLPLGCARLGPGLQPRQMTASPMRCAAHGSSLAHPLERRAGVVVRHSRLLGGLVRRAALGVEPRPYASRDRGRLDAVPALQLDLSTVLPLGIARGWRCRSSCSTALAWHVPIL
jgi:hypothetical protein